MAIEAVNSSPVAVNKAVQQPRPQPDQTQKNEASKAEQAARQAQQQAQQAQKTEQPKPVVNTQGQTTGRVINATA